MNFFLNIKRFKDYFSKIYCVFVYVYMHMYVNVPQNQKNGHWMQ